MKKMETDKMREIEKSLNCEKFSVCGEKWERIKVFSKTDMFLYRNNS